MKSQLIIKTIKVLLEIIIVLTLWYGAYHFGKYLRKYLPKPQPEQVMCNDGTYSKKGRGACSWHGGIKR